MSRDTSLEVRRAILTHAKADADVTALVPADRIYPPQTPALPDWPFVRYGAASQVPLRASGMDGSRIASVLHAFAKGPGEDEASRIAAALARALDGAVLTLEGGWKATVQHAGTQMLVDPAEANAWHGVVNLEVTVSSS